MKMQTDTSYTLDDAYVDSTSDQDGNTTNYTYDQSKGLLTSTKDVNGNTINYTYDANTDQLTSVSSTVSTAQGSQTLTNRYEYSNNDLKKLTHNGFDYNFTYDKFGNSTAVKVGTQSLIEYSYNHNNGSLQNVLYGNQDTTAYTYDEYGNVTNVAVNGVDRYQSFSNKLGDITKHEDLLNKQLYNYEYDINGRLVRQSVEDTSKAIGNERNLYLLEYAYDNMDNISGFINKVGKKTFKHSYTYTLDNLLSSYAMPSGKIVNYNYDDLNRLSQYQINTTSPLTVAYEYEASKRNAAGQSTYQTTRVSQETVGNKGSKYTYDKKGNITSISEKNQNGTFNLINSYQYDELNQLVREDDVNQGKTKVYTYDLGGNIISVKEYEYTLAEEEPANLVNTVNYGYSDTNWKDKLTSYNGQPITYDEIGNPTSYNGYSLEWDNGRELSSLSGNAVNAFYTYDADGLRSTKTVNGVKTTYEYIGGRLLYEKKGSTELHYFYDTNGSLKGIQTIDSTGTAKSYYVFTNTRGDVTQIYDSIGSLKVQYTYDSWGKIFAIKDGTGNEITSADDIGKLNSFRYRSYYYDDEMGMYYLLGRYYDPTVCRMLNADAYMNGNANMMENNLFGYASNNPVTYYDPTGSFVDTVVDIISVSWSAYDLYKHPTWGNLGYLAWDVVAAAVPIVPASYVAKGAKALSKADDVVDAVKGAGKTGGRLKMNLQFFAENNDIKNVYNSIKNAPKYPNGFKAVQNGMKKVNINNNDVLNELRRIENAQWKKVYKDGYDISGKKISIHYFESSSGKVFDVKVKAGWSN